MDWIRIGLPPPITRSPILIFFVCSRYIASSPFLPKSCLYASKPAATGCDRWPFSLQKVSLPENVFAHGTPVRRKDCRRMGSSFFPRGFVFRSSKRKPSFRFSFAAVLLFSYVHY